MVRKFANYLVDLLDYGGCTEWKQVSTTDRVMILLRAVTFVVIMLTVVAMLYVTI